MADHQQAGIPANDIHRMIAESQAKEAAAKVKAGAPPESVGLPAMPTVYGVGCVPDAGLVVLTLGTPYGPLSFSLRPEQLEGEDGTGMVSGLQQALAQAKSGLVVANGSVSD